MRKKKLLGSVILVAIVCAISSWYWIKHREGAMHAKPEATVVEAEKVQQGNVTIEAHAIGSLVAQNNITITSEMEGHVAKVFFKDGEFVKQGTPLIQLDDSVSKVRVASAKASLIQAENHYKRNAALGKKGIASKHDVELTLAEFKEKQALAKEEQVKLSKMLLVAPFDGVLGKSKVGPGDYVNVGKELVSLTDTQHLRVEYSIPEKFYPTLKLGQEIKIITSTYPNKEFVGKVTFVSPTANADDRTIALYADISNDSGLLTAGLFVNVTQSLGKQSNALLVPAISLMPTIDGQQVFKIVDNKAVSVPVVIGQRTENTVEVVKGLALDDTVVTAGQQKLKDGMLVKIKAM